jgi:hypothetical protein
MEPGGRNRLQSVGKSPSKETAQKRHEVRGVDAPGPASLDVHTCLALFVSAAMLVMTSPPSGSLRQRRTRRN